MSLTPPQPLAREVEPIPDEELAEIRQADADWPEEGRQRVVFARHRHLLLLEVDRLRAALDAERKRCAGVLLDEAARVRARPVSRDDEITLADAHDWIADILTEMARVLYHDAPPGPLTRDFPVLSRERTDGEPPAKLRPLLVWCRALLASAEWAHVSLPGKVMLDEDAVREAVRRLDAATPHDPLAREDVTE